VNLVAPHLGRRHDALLDETSHAPSDTDLRASCGLSRYLTNRERTAGLRQHREDWPVQGWRQRPRGVTQIHDLIIKAAI